MQLTENNQKHNIKKISRNKNQYRIFEEAKDYVRQKNLQNRDDWIAWTKTREKPVDIPTNPSWVYKNDWISWGNWLGTDYVGTRDRVYRPFEDARNYIRNLKLNSKEHWAIWTKTENRPGDIPTNPTRVYKNDWISWGDWLGTYYIAAKDREYRPFEDARKYVHLLGIKNQNEWRQWSKLKKRPLDIPAAPDRTYRNLWQNWPDFLGTTDFEKYVSFGEAKKLARALGVKNRKEWYVIFRKLNISNIPANPQPVYEKEWKGWEDFLGSQVEYRSFESARDYVSILNFKSQDEYSAWANSSNRPTDVPKYPRVAYKNDGWKNFPHFLSIKQKRFDESVNRAPSYEKLKIYVHKLGIKNKDAWTLWAKSDQKPENIPASPSVFYADRGWIGWGDFLGTKKVAAHKKIFRNFIEAREYVRSLALLSETDWNNWAKSEKRPRDIPSSPRKTYKNSGWISFSDWLGNGYRTYQTFCEARNYVRSLKLKSRAEFKSWAKSDKRPEDIPLCPYHVYKTEWYGWSDWIGNTNAWTKTAVLGFLKSIEPILNSLKPAELYSIMNQNGMLDSIKESTKSHNLLKNLKSLCSSQDHETDFRELMQTIESENNDNFDSNSEINDFDIEKSNPINISNIDENDEKEELPYLKDLKDLSSVDILVNNSIISDEETIEFLISNRVGLLWNNVLNHKDKININELRQKSEGIYFDIIKNKFFEQYDGANSIETPQDWQFKDEDGKVVYPNLMQKLTTYRVLKENRIGNWSGTGAGKTISAILTSRVINAKLTIIIAFNSTIEGWKKAILHVFPNSNVIVKGVSNFEINEHKQNYILLNFEKFQQLYSNNLVLDLVNNYNVDFIVLDEIQSVKQRDEKKESKRRELIKSFIIRAEEKNKNLYLLGMSATPVINNLFEGKALLELVTGLEFRELETSSTINNAILLHQKLVLHGIRYKPEYEQNISEIHIKIDGNNHLKEIQKISKKDLMSIERILLDIKLPETISLIKKGTMIYTHYKTQMVSKIERSIRAAGYSAGLYTGDEKSGLLDFVSGKIDVLIGTAPIGTGIDGLQKVCNRLIILSLPWTSSEYQQLIGRIYRQGSNFVGVDVFIPQVILNHNDQEWSWDKNRLKRIQYKKTLADAALDGVIPEGVLESDTAMLKNAYEALQDWIKRIENEGIFAIERNRLQVPLEEEISSKLIRKYGDFTMMNSKINSSNSKTTHERFNKDHAEWYLYHTHYSKARETWLEIPYEIIAQSILQRPDWVVGDFGCGEAKLSTLIPNKIYSFDHVAINQNVVSCDLSKVPLGDSCLDVVVFSLSLMGLNYDEYLKEAHRTLKFGGILKIAEPLGRWRDSNSELLQKIRIAGFQITGEPRHSDQFLYINAIKI